MTKIDPESTLTLKAGAILALVTTLIVALLGWGLGNISGHETRIAKLETTIEIMIPALTNKLDEINDQIREMRGGSSTHTHPGRNMLK